MKNVNPMLAADDERFHDLLAEYLRRVDQGEYVDQAAFLSAHPEYSAALAEYFDGASAIEEMAGPRVAPFDAQGTVHRQFDAETSTDGIASNTKPTPLVSADGKTLARQSEEQFPETFGRYRILKALGQGAMGAVYLAQDMQLERQVALKIPKFSGAMTADLLARFYREARAAAKLRNPSICPVFDVGEIEGRHYITMAFIEGCSLGEFAHAKNRQPEKQVAVLVRKLALALAEAHAHGIIHRDLKPANIMVDKKGEPVVMDFGLARREEGDDKHVTREGAILGTPAYMSPEQVAGDQSKIGPPADIYSLGVVMYELLTGKVPFGGSLMSILMQIASEQPQPPALHRPGLDPHLEAICLKMMAKKTADRYGSMDDVAQTLGEYLKSAVSESSVENALASASVGNAVLGFPGESVDNDAEIASPGGSFTVVPGELHASPLPRGASKDIKTRSVSEGKEKTPSLTRRVISAPKTWLAIGSILVSVFILLAAVTLYIRLGNVDVMVVIRDENLAVKFGKQTVTIEGSGAPIRLKPGERKFIVEKDGLEVETDNFVVKKEGRNVLEVSLVDGRVVITKDGHPSLVKRDPEPIGKAEGWHGWPKDAPPPAIAPFDAKQAKAHQESWAKYLNVPVEYTNSIGMKFRLIPPSEFLMGSTPAEIEEALKVAVEDKHWQECIKSEGPQHKVILTQPIYFGVHEVTQAEYEKVMGKNPSWFAKSGPDKQWVERITDLDTSGHPVEGVSWNDAAEFCAKLSVQEKLTPLYSRNGETVTEIAGTGYRLPTEAHWEFACRAGTTTKYWTGDTDKDLRQAGWFVTNAGMRTHKGGELNANPFGLYDIHGNVWEWTQDWWEPAYYGQFRERPALDPRGPSSDGSQRVIRSGGWHAYSSHCRASGRLARDSLLNNLTLGFRAALPADAVKVALKDRESKRATDCLAQVRSGIWEVQQDELIHTDAKSDDCCLFFGDSTWTNYDYSFEAVKTNGAFGVSALFRARDPRNYLVFDLAGVQNRKYTVECFVDGKHNWVKFDVAGKMAVRQKYQVRVEARGDHFRCFVDGELVYDFHDKRQDRGGVGFRCWGGAVRLSSIRVTDLDGRALWEGPPDLPGAEAQVAVSHAWPKDAPLPAIAPFDAKQAKAHQEAWAKYLKVPVEFENSIGMKFRLVPPGEFLMGIAPLELDAALKAAGDDKQWQECVRSESPQHKVILTQPVYLGIHKVTQKDYQAVIGKNPSHFAPTGTGKDAVAGLDTSLHPVDTVSWNDAAEFCAKLSEQEKLKPFYSRNGETVTMLPGIGYRLPTDAEWERASRAGTTANFWVGEKDEDLLRAGWCNVNSGGRTHRVGELTANPFGLYDMHGNVWEWVRDWWEPEYYREFQERPARDPSGPASAGSRRVIRGGSWHTVAFLCRASSRHALDPAVGGMGVGFRVALPVDAVKNTLSVPDREANGTVFPGFSVVPLHLVKQRDEYRAVREELESLRKTSKQDYHIVILPTLGDYLPRPADYLRKLAAEWEQQAAERKLPLNAERLVIVVMAPNDQQLQIHFGPTLKDGLRLDGPPVTKELLVPHFLPFAREGKMSEGLVSLLRGTEKWIAEHEAAKGDPAK